MKILLIFSQNRSRKNLQLSEDDISIPLGIGYLASVLEREKHDVHVFDFQLRNATEEQLISKIESEDFDLFGISAATPAAYHAYDTARLLKERCPDVPVVLGGPHVSAVKENIFKECRHVDILVFGEGDDTIVDIVKAISVKSDLRTIAGISYIDKGMPVTTSRRAYVKDLDNIPFPAYHLFDVDRYKNNPFPGQFFRLPMLNIITSRGCPFKCIFCDRGSMGEAFRSRSAANIVAEIGFLVERYGVKEIRFHDDNFMVDRKRVHEFCELLLKKKLDIVWRCSARVDLVDKETLSLMRRAGFVSISFGIESGSEKILKSIKKGITKEQVRNALRSCKELGIETKAFFMMNLPGETIEDVEETLKFGRELPLDWASYQIAFPIPGTELRETVRKNNYTIDYSKWDNWGVQMSNEIYYEQDGLPAEYLRKAMKRAWRGFYLRPRIIFNFLKRIRDLQTLKSYLRGLAILLRLRAIG